MLKKKRIISLIMACVMLLGTLICFDKATLKTYAATPGISYTSYVQGLGWLDWKKNGTMSGTTGRSKRLEGLKVKLVNKSVQGSVVYRAYIGNQGWQSWFSNGEIAGEVGESKQIEAVEIKLTKDMAKQYDIYYRVHVQSKGWLSWAKNGKTAGTTGINRRIEAIQIKLVKKGAKAPGDTSNPYISYSDGVYADTVSDVMDLLRNVGFYNVGANVERKTLVSYYDVNGDGIKELFISTKHHDYDTDYEEINSFKMYTMVNNKVKEVVLPEKGRSRYDFIITSDNQVCITFKSNHPNMDKPDYHFYSLSADGRLVEKKAYQRVWGAYYGRENDLYIITHGKDTIAMEGYYGSLFLDSAVEQSLENVVEDIDRTEL